jgi:type II secretory pathway component HofQ
VLALLLPVALAAAPGHLYLEVQDAKLSGVLRLISETSGQSYVLREEDDCDLTLRLMDVHWTVALEASLATCGLEAVPVGDGSLVRIATRA